MFYTYDLSSFGLELSKIRKKFGLSQMEVKEMTGINEDTLRRIENGHVIPKYETLEILSIVYNYDLLEMLQTFRVDKHFYTYYALIDKALVYNDIQIIEEIIKKYSESISDVKKTTFLINKPDIEQFDSFLKGVKSYFLEDDSKLIETKQCLIDTIKITHKVFKIDNFDKYNYNLLQIRIILLLALVLEKLEEYDLSTNMMIFSYNYLLADATNNSEAQKLILKLVYNLSYNFHKMDNHSLALHYANEGIEYAIKNSSCHCLYSLLARKGIAEFLLNRTDYVDSLQKSIHMLEISKQYELADLYKKKFLEKYNITL